jgi:putative ABC transport system permease protein
VIYLARYLSLRYWMRHRGAFWLSTLGVALGLSVFVSIQIANNSVLSAFAASLDAVSGKTNLQISGGTRGLPDETLAQIRRRNDPRIRASAPIISKTLYSPTLQTSVLVLGIDIFAEPDFRPFDLPTTDTGQGEARAGTSSADASEVRGGSVARFLLDPHAITIGRALATRKNLQVGSKIQVYSGAIRRSFEVVHILDGEEWDSAFGGDFIALDIASAQEALGMQGRLTQIDLIVDEKQLDAVARDLRARLPAGVTVERPAQRGSQVTDLLAAFQLNLTALSCISLFVGAFLIYNAIAIAVVRRRGEVGILRAIGAERGQITRLFLFEAAAIGLAGSILGFALGLLLARATLGAVGTTVSALYIAVKAREFTVPLWLWWGAPLGGTLLAVVSALPAALEAGGTSPRAALQRVTLHHTAARWALPVAASGAFSLLIAFVLCQPFIAEKSMFAGFAAAFFTLGGFALMTPLLTLWGGRIAGPAAGAVFGIEGRIAGSYLQRAIGRSSLVVAALMVSLAMTIGMTVMVRSFRTSVEQWVDTVISADLYIAPATGFSGDQGPGLPTDVTTYAQNLPGLTAIDIVRSTRAQIGNQPVQISANEQPSLRTGDRVLPFKSTVNGESAAITAYLSGQAILVSERFESLVGRGTGETIELPTPAGPKQFPIAGVFYDYTPNECLIYVPRALYQRYWGDNAIDGLALYFRDAAQIGPTIREMQRRFGPRYQLTLLQNREIRASVFKTFDQTFAVTYALQLISILVAAIGIFDTLIALLLERSRELAALRALGASGGQIIKTTLVEFALVGVFSWVIGTAAGLCLAWQLIYVINRQFFGWTIGWTLPPGILVQSLALSLIAAIGAGIWPAIAASRRHIASALQVE